MHSNYWCCSYLLLNPSATSATRLPHLQQEEELAIQWNEASPVDKSLINGFKRCNVFSADMQKHGFTTRLDPTKQVIFSSALTGLGMQNICNTQDCKNYAVHDMRQEPHFTACWIKEDQKQCGAFVIRNKNNDPVKDTPLEEIINREVEIVRTINEGNQALFDIVQKNPDKKADLWFTPFATLKLFHAKTEKQLVEEFGATYYRHPTTDHHPASDANLEKIAEIVKNNPEQLHHVHCAGGKGRTLQAAFAAMSAKIASIANTIAVPSFKDLAKHYKKMGGKNPIANNKKGKGLTNCQREKIVRSLYQHHITENKTTPFSLKDYNQECSLTIKDKK